MDISFNAIGNPAVQNTPLVRMSLEDLIAPIVTACRTPLVTATAAARQMIAQRFGVIILLSSSAARESLDGGGWYQSDFELSPEEIGDVHAELALRMLTGRASR